MPRESVPIGRVECGSQIETSDVGSPCHRASWTLAVLHPPGRVEADLSQTPMDLWPEVLEDVYRIVQETLHNVVEHAHAKTATVRIDMESGDRRCVVVEVMDHGDTSVRGAAPSALHARVVRWGGDLRTGSIPHGGSRVRVTLPLPSTSRVSTAGIGGGP